MKVHLALDVELIGETEAEAERVNWVIQESINDLLLAAALEAQGGVIARRDLDEHFEANVTPLTFGRARLNVGRRGSLCYDDGW
jgi:hypothetical protein